ncbi:MAG: 50S ribosomal protein L24 [Metamycoplasmataceae bacterium]
MKLRKNDEVVILSGSEKGKSGFIIKIDNKTQRVVIKDVNMVTKHLKPTQEKTEGSIEQKEASIHISNVALKTKQSKKGVNEPTKIGYKIHDGKKVRFERKTGKEV